MNQDMYYIAIADGKTEGPVSLEVLEDYFNQKKINAKTMIFQEGGQEWEEFEKVLAKYHKKIVPKTKASSSQTPSFTTLIGYYFPMIGGFVAVAGIIGFFVCITNELVGLSIACLLSGFFSLMFFLWMGQIYDRIAECAHILKNMQDRNK